MISRVDSGPDPGPPGIRILVAPSGFKECLDAAPAADYIEEGIQRVVPSAALTKVPLFDGGEGFAAGIVAATRGYLKHLYITGPTGPSCKCELQACEGLTNPVAAIIESHYGFLGGSPVKTAVVEIAAAAGLSLVPKECRNPTTTTTFGVGELIADALHEGAQKIIIGCGDSGTCDGGAGMCQALGIRFLDGKNDELAPASGGKALSRLTRLDLSNLHSRLRHVQIEAVCNWKNVLCGAKGVAQVYGPQKGATAEQVIELGAALDIYSSVLSQTLGENISVAPGSGASGGLGAGLLLIGAKLRPRYEAITEYFGIEDCLENCDLVVTAEGGIDYQTPQGKIPAEIATRAKRRGIPVVMLAGTVGQGSELSYGSGIDAFTSILQRPISLEGAMRDVERLLKDGAESAMRMIMVGSRLSNRFGDGGFEFKKQNMRDEKRGSNGSYEEGSD